jgi:hypothetical protein
MLDVACSGRAAAAPNQIARPCGCANAYYVACCMHAALQRNLALRASPSRSRRPAHTAACVSSWSLRPRSWQYLRSAVRRGAAPGAAGDGPVRTNQRQSHTPGSLCTRAAEGSPCRPGVRTGDQARRAQVVVHVNGEHADESTAVDAAPLAPLARRLLMRCTHQRWRSASAWGSRRRWRHQRCGGRR